MDTSSGNFGTNMTSQNQTASAGAQPNYSDAGYATAGYSANPYTTVADAGADPYTQGAYGMNAVPDASAMNSAYDGATQAGGAMAGQAASGTSVSPFAPADIPDDTMSQVSNDPMNGAAVPSIDSMSASSPDASSSTSGARQVSSDATFAIPNLSDATGNGAVAQSNTASMSAEKSATQSGNATEQAGTTQQTSATQQADATKLANASQEASSAKANGASQKADATQSAKPATEPKTASADAKVNNSSTTDAKKASSNTEKKPNVLKNEIPKTAMDMAATAKPVAKKAESKSASTSSAKTSAASAGVAGAAAATAGAVVAGVATASASGVSIEALLEECIRHNASDLHLQVNLPPILRIDGVLRPMTTYPALDNETVKQLVFSTLDEDQQKILIKDKEFDYSFAFGDLGRFRVNAFHEKGNMAAAFRLIPNVIKSIEDLGMPAVVSTFADRPNGLVLVTGPTGSGKSTTLAALVDKINTERAVHIITIEDPIEFTHQSKRAVVAQREVHYDTFSFAAALRSILREDPDVVLIGEMRDLETIQAAITVAETGHLVFATLHTNSAAQSIDRMIDVFPAHQQPQVRTQLANILVGICSQRLVPAINGGRVAVAEIMVANSAVRSIIREGKTHQLDMTIQTGAEQGMQTMDRELAKYVKSGIISYDDAREYAVDVTEFDRLARG